MIPTPVDNVAGHARAAAVLHAVLGDAVDTERLALLVLGVVHEQVRAELLADLSDDAYELADVYGSAALRAFALGLEHASDALRKGVPWTAP